MNLTADQIIVDGDTAYVVAEGELDHDDHLPPACGDPGCGLGPPDWMTATCETCGGTGRWWDLPLQPSGDPFERDDCADCIGGKPIHTFEVNVPCAPRADLCPHEQCGTISYRLVVREVLPIIPPNDPNFDREDEVVIADGQAYRKGAGLTLPPAAKPGMWLAICEVVR